MTIKLDELHLDGLRLLTPQRFGDARGFFSETYSARSFLDVGIGVAFVQDNHSCSATPGTVRGLHFQKPPYAQDKLVRVTRGRILDVAVDIRRGSDTYGRHIAIELSAEDWTQIFVPKGFAHGFCTLEADTEVIYKVSNFYEPKHDAGIIWNDPSLAIAWPDFAGSQVSDKDSALPRLADILSPFE